MLPLCFSRMILLFSPRQNAQLLISFTGLSCLYFFLGRCSVAVEGWSPNYLIYMDILFYEYCIHSIYWALVYRLSFSMQCRLYTSVCFFVWQLCEWLCLFHNTNKWTVRFLSTETHSDISDSCFFMMNVCSLTVFRVDCVVCKFGCGCFMNVVCFVIWTLFG